MRYLITLLPIFLYETHAEQIDWKLITDCLTMIVTLCSSYVF